MDLIGGPAGSGESRLDLVTAVGVGIMSIDATGRITSANAAATAILRCSDADLVGRGAHEALNAELPVDACELEDSARTGVAAHIDSDTFVRADGSSVAVWWSTTPVRDPDSAALVSTILVFGDTSAQRAQADAAAAERSQGRADLAAARQNVADLQWIAGVAQALSSTLDEREVLERLARLVVGRLCDVALTDVIAADGTLERVGRAVADGLHLDIGTVLAAAESEPVFERDTATFRTAHAPGPMLIDADHFDDPTLLSPASRHFLRTIDAAQLLVVPMAARGRDVGALGLMRVRGSVPFSPMDELVAGDIAQRAAVAWDNARLYRAQTDISTRLQQALLPSVPKDVPIDVAVRYLPARNRFEVGGDWYDVFRVHEQADTTVLVIGDVAGHDLEAGTAMSALRNLLRGIVVATNEGPRDALNSVDSNMTILGIPGTATALVMTVTPLSDGRWNLVWSNAGHMPPLLINADDEVELLNEVHGTLLGTDIPQRRGQSERTVDGGSTIVLYTDGLVETREETIDSGLTRLRRTAISADRLGGRPRRDRRRTARPQPCERRGRHGHARLPPACTQTVITSTARPNRTPSRAPVCRAKDSRNSSRVGHRVVAQALQVGRVRRQ